ncbi:hypothetical protein PVAND_013306 [Polypedilum vanderplanki]|uniref:F-box domain-containing protein n=1 Tax=Polypedilum vanderplanki TaxID=319348 RepID=A0A9J6CPA6_POLVA|nr:hypothetical protein PVAND_013306 [Polypedilum vanderplanki]
MDISKIYGDLKVLPTEILIKIFTLVGNRYYLSLVNSEFYDIVCKIEENKFQLKLIDIDDDEEKFKSIINSRRVFDEVKLMDIRSNENHVTDRMREIFTKYGNDIKKINFYNSKLPESQFIDILSMNKHLQTLILYDVDFSITEKENVELMLPELKTLKTYLCNFIIPRIIFRFPKDTLEHLSINNCILDQQTFGRILQNQQRIKQLEIDPYNVDPAQMSELKLEKLKLLSKRHVKQILQSQQQLITLDLERAHIGDSEFMDICKMTQLKSLRLWIDRISWEKLDNLMKLNKLEELALTYDRLEVEYVTMLSKVPLISITTLKIEFPKLKMLTESFIAISINCPNIKTLVINGQSIGVIGTIVQYFKNLETLNFECDSDSVKVVNFPITDIYNEKLKRLRIFDNQFNNPAREQFQSQLTLICLIMQSMPNLEQLELVNTISLELDDLANILACNRKLSQFRIEDISINLKFDKMMADMIKRCNGNLNYFEFNKIAVEIDENSLRQIMDNKFAFINCRDWKNQVILRNCQWSPIENEIDI